MAINRQSKSTTTISMCCHFLVICLRMQINCNSFCSISCCQSNGTLNLEIVQMILLTLYAFGVIYPVCELGQQVRNDFDEISTTIYQMNWYSFPTQIQRILPIILLGSQKPVQIRSFGNIETTRETFKIVFHNILV